MKYHQEARTRLLSSVSRMLPLKLRRELLFLRRHHYWLPRQPETFSEKIQWRIIHDRRDLIAVGGDKLRMKEYARQHSAEVLIPETLWVGESLEGILDYDWSCDWVLKPITGSGHAAFGSGTLRGSGITADCVDRWPYRALEFKGEWAYGQADKGFFLERRIEMPGGVLPTDLKFFVFDGRVRLIYYSTPRNERESHRFYSPAWDVCNFRRPDVECADPVDPPGNLSRLIAIAETIGREYDFIRVDLYNTDSGVYFGELTPYPAAGLRRFSPRSADLELGSYWNLPSDVSANK